MLTTVMVLSLPAALIGGALLLSGKRIPANEQSPADRIEALLPKTQCAQCGYPGCRPYAEAVASGAADIDQCAPGGEATVTALANLLGRTTRPLNPEFGQSSEPLIAVINENACIGCRLCIDACPVDAIVGAAQFTHTVIEKECTGCELCLPPCPVDCIDLQVVPLGRRHGD